MGTVVRKEKAMGSKEKCKKLKEIRKKIADKIGVDLNQTECTYEGECKGTCPKCAQEEKTLNKALLRGGTAVAGVALSMLTLTGCNESDDNTLDLGKIKITTEKELEGIEEPLDGDVVYTETEETTSDIEGGEAENPDYTTENNTTENNTTEDDDTEEAYMLEGDVVMIISDDEILEKCKSYTGAPYAEVDRYEDDGITVVVHCFEIVKDEDGLHTATIDWISVNKYTGDAENIMGETFNLWDI